MVQTEISQLSAECSEWRQILRNYREEFHNCEKALTETCKQSLSKDLLTKVERFQNQFDIQLRNIHDLKQTIKKHGIVCHWQNHRRSHPATKRPQHCCCQ